MKKVVFLFLLFASAMLHAQFKVNSPSPQTTDQIVKNILVGKGIVPLKITFNGSPLKGTAINDQVGFWNTNFNMTNTGFGTNEKGLVLTTGKVGVAVGPNNLAGAEVDTSTPIVGDADLTKLSGKQMANVAILEFDFVATGLELDFDFVFGSEEYPEWVNSSFNDAFGFFLSGPGIIPDAKGYSNGAKNIALIPGTNTGVSINTVNAGLNANYYVDNLNGTDLQYDGFTKVIRAKSALQPCSTYHIKLAIGNAVNNQFDSGLLLKNFEIPPMELHDNYNLPDNPSVCYGETLTISSGITEPNAVFQWTKDGAPLPDNGPDLTVTSAGKYGLKVLTPPPGNCVFASDDITIGYLPPLAINNPTDLSICTSQPPPYTFNINQTAAMLGSSDYTVSYYDSSFTDAHDGVPTGVVLNSGLANYSVNGTSKTIWVRFEDSNTTGCVEVKSFNLIANSLPTITGSTSVCLGLQTQLSGSDTPATSNAWTSSNTAVATVDNTGLVKGMSQGSADITYTNSKGCKQTKTIAVTGLPTVNISATTPVCEGTQATVTFTGTPNSTVTYTVDSGLNQTIVLGSSGINSVNTPALSNNTTYTLKSIAVTATPACAQPQSGSVTIQVLSSPTATISYSGPYCVSMSGQVAVTQTGVTGGTYTATPNGLTINAANGDITPSSSTPENYTVTYTVAATGSCPELVKTAAVKILDLPHPKITAGDVCVDPDTNEVLPGSSATVDSGLDAADYTFQWYDSTGALVGTDAKLQTNVAGVYTLNVTAAGCTSTATATVGTTYIAKSAVITISDYFKDSKITIDVVGKGTYLYELDNNGTFQKSNVFTNVAPGTHTVTVTDSVACTHLVYKDILIIDYPKFFTPNGDTYNDTWNIVSLSDQQNAEIFVFDRYGKLIKQLTPSGQGWDGTYNGYSLPASDYWFTVKYAENGVEKLFKSHFSLKR